MKEELITILLAMSPTFEAHGAIAVAIGVFKFSAVKAFLLSVAGSLFLIGPLLVFWHYLADFFMRRFYFINRFLTWLFAYTRAKHIHHFETFGQSEENPQKKTTLWKAIALYVFVAVPGPFTGVWAGTVAAFVFGIPFRYSVVSIALGAISVALIDALVITGFFRLIF